MVSTSSTNVQLDRKKVLGKGKYSTIFQGTFAEENVAVKRVLLSNVHRQWENDSDNILLNKLENLNYPNLLKIFTSYFDSDFRYFVVELALGSLFDYFNNVYKGDVPSEANALHQMASGLHYVHTEGFVHGDIKPENVLIFSSTALKISDFGLIAPISPTASFSMSHSSVKSSSSMQAPEMLLHGEKEEETEENYGDVMSQASDTFSLGCLFYSFLTKGGHPFLSGTSAYTVVPNIIKGTYNLNSLEDSHFAVPLIKKMIKTDPKERIQLEQVVKIVERHLS